MVSLAVAVIGYKVVLRGRRKKCQEVNVFDISDNLDYTINNCTCGDE
jgi:hypothetical protein